MLFTPSAVAFFDDECDKPKASYERFLQAAQRLKSSEDKAQRLANERYAVVKEEYRRCQRNPKSFFLEKRIDAKKYGNTSLRCFSWYEEMLSTKVIGIPGQSVTSYEQYKRAMLVIKSYKKCFEPDLYVSAVEWLKRNK
jgi:hypothetical protein